MVHQEKPAARRRFDKPTAAGTAVLNRIMGAQIEAVQRAYFIAVSPAATLLKTQIISRAIWRHRSS